MAVMEIIRGRGCGVVRGFGSSRRGNSRFRDLGSFQDDILINEMVRVGGKDNKSCFSSRSTLSMGERTTMSEWTSKGMERRSG